MKKRISLSAIKEGSCFTADVYIDEGNLLVPARIPVKQKDLDMLKKWGVSSVLTEGELIAMPASPPPLVKAKTGGEVLLSRYGDLVDKLKPLFEKMRRAEVVEPRSIDQLAQGVLQLARDERDKSISAILGDEPKSDDLARSAVNIALLSVVIGQGLNLQPFKLSYLATGALLHDCGMLRVPEFIFKKEGRLSEDEAQKMRAHPLLSYKIITKELLYPDEVGLIGLQHHERWDGEGYPRKVGGDGIDRLARIVSVADAFEAMVSEKPYRNPMIGYAAMKALLSDNSRRFDPEVLKAFIRSMGIYPIGSLVLLNNASIGRIVKNHPEAPLRPEVRIIVDIFGAHFDGEDGELIDLLAERSIFIARPIDPKEIAQ